MKYKISLLALMISSLFLPPAFAGQESGGGILISAQFAKVGRKAIEFLSKGDSSLHLQDIYSSISQTKVIPVEEICYTEPTLGIKYCEDAHFDADNNTILLAFKKWSGFSCAEKLVLSSHEFFRAAGLEGEDYKYSSRFTDRSFVVDPIEDPVERADLFMQIQREINVFCEYLEAEQNTSH